MASPSVRATVSGAGLVVVLTGLMGAVAAPDPSQNAGGVGIFPANTPAARVVEDGPSIASTRNNRHIAPLSMPAALLAEAQALEKASHFEEAAAGYIRAHQSGLATRDFSVAATALRYHALMLSRNDPQAGAEKSIALLRDALEIDDTYDLADNTTLDTLALARVYLARGQAEDQAQAASLYGDVRGAEPGEELLVVAQVGMGQAARESRGDAREALEINRAALLFYKKIKDIPRQADMWYRIGLRHIDLRQFDDARGAFQESERLWQTVTVGEWYGTTPTQRIERARLSSAFAELAELSMTTAPAQEQLQEIGRRVSPSLTSGAQTWTSSFAELVQLYAFALEGQDIRPKAAILRLRPELGDEERVWLDFLRLDQAVVRGDPALKEISTELASSFRGAWCHLPLFREELRHTTETLKSEGAMESAQQLERVCE